jgi:hypothetical protein
VASVKPNKSEGMMELGGHNEKFNALRISLEGLIEYAYNINHNEMVGPAWLGSETYDIEAKPEHPVSIAQIRLMLQTLLADRFKHFPSQSGLTASLRSDGVRDHPGMPFGFLPETAFSFTGIPSSRP